MSQIIKSNGKLKYIEKLLTDYVNENDVDDIKIIIDELWNKKSVKLLPKR